MKNLFFHIAALPLTLMLLGAAVCACTREDVQAEDGGSPAEIDRDLIEVSFHAAPDTKSTSISAIETLDVLLFREGGALEASGRSSGGATVTLTVRPGETYHWYALANAPEEILSVHSEDGLRRMRLSLSGCREAYCPMYGSGEALLVDGSEVNATLRRGLSKVSLEGLSAPFLAEGYLIGEARLERLFLMNAPGEGALLPDGSAPGVRLNRDGVDPSLSESLKGFLVAERRVSLSPTEVTDGTALLCCPDAEGKTVFVLEVTLDGERSYYGIPLPELKANTYYKIRDLVLLGPGAPTPGEAPCRDETVFSVEITPWSASEREAKFE